MVSDFKLNFDLDDSISRFPDEGTNQSQPNIENLPKTELFPADEGDDAQDIDESQFKRAVGINDNSQSQDPSTQDVINLDWTQTQPIRESRDTPMSADHMTKSEITLKQETETSTNDDGNTTSQKSEKDEEESPADVPDDEDDDENTVNMSEEEKEDAPKDVDKVIDCIKHSIDPRNEKEEAHFGK